LGVLKVNWYHERGGSEKGDRAGFTGRQGKLAII